MNGMETMWSWIAFFILIMATMGTFLPVLPGLSLMAIVVLAYGWLENFTRIDPAMITITLIFTFIGTAMDYAAGPYTARRVGATKGGVWGAVLGGIAGIFLLGPVGLILGPFVGAVLGEILNGKGLKRASEIGLASMLGILMGNLVKFILALIITVMFFLRVIK